jgi:hypothetical protein
MHATSILLKTQIWSGDNSIAVNMRTTATEYNWRKTLITMLRESGILSTFTVFSIALCLLTVPVFCQKKGMTFAEAAKNGNSLQHLDSIYWSGVHVDTSKAAFCRSLYDSVHNEYVFLLKSLGKFLNSKAFKWGKQVQCFNKIYFSQSGEIDFFLYNFTPHQIDQKKAQEFECLLNEFIDHYKFRMVSKNKFSLCSSVLYND